MANGVEDHQFILVAVTESAPNAALWPIYDAAAAQASQGFYEILTATGAFLTDHAADAVHAAVTELRDVGNAMLPTIWAPYAHVGP